MLFMRLWVRGDGRWVGDEWEREEGRGRVRVKVNRRGGAVRDGTNVKDWVFARGVSALTALLM
jgi:hypothetical protein